MTVFDWLLLWCLTSAVFVVAWCAAIGSEDFRDNDDAA